MKNRLIKTIALVVNTEKENIIIEHKASMWKIILKNETKRFV